MAGKNAAFAAILAAVAVLSLPFMGYISCASYIYIDFFGLNTFEYSAFFAANAALSVLGAALALVVSKRFGMKSIFTGIIIVSLLSGAALLAFGELSPFAFFAAFGVFGLVGSVSRPLTTNILLDQQEKDTGSASSLINFICNIAGCIGMGAAVLPWPNYVFGLGTLIVSMSLLALVIWILLLRSNVNVKGL